MHAIPHKYSKIYLSVSETRRRSIDEPVGDPYGGAAYGERRMPVAAIAVFAYGASIVATEMVIGGLLMASGALSFVGSVTGNKTLSMLGAVAGIAAGGMGMLEGGAAAVESTSEAYINSGSMGGSVSNAVAASPVAGMDATANTSTDALQQLNNAGVTAPDVSGNGLIGTIQNAPAVGINPLESAGMNTNAIAGVDTNTNQILGMPDGPDGFNPGQGYQAPGSEQTAATNPGAESNPLAPKVEAPKTNFADPNYADGGISPEESLRGDVATPKPEKGLLDTAMEKLNGVGKFAKDNKELLDYGGNMLKAYGESDLNDAKQKLYEAQANGNDAQAEYYRAKIAEMNRLAANANARGTNALNNGNAISSNGSAYSNNPTRAGNALSFGKA